MKKLLSVFVFVLVFVATASAQFEKGKIYCNASLSGIGLSYNGAENWRYGIEAKGGYLLEDNWMVLAKIGIDRKDSESGTTLDYGVGGRYYIIQNGLFLGAGVSYKHAYHTYDDVVPGVEIGYAFFINGHCTIEPSLYYDQSLKDHSNYSTVGIRIGVGLYL